MVNPQTYLDKIDFSLITQGIVNSYASNIDSYKELLQNALDELIRQYHNNPDQKGDLKILLDRSGKHPKLRVSSFPGHYTDVVGSVLPGSKSSHLKRDVKGTAGGMSFGLASQYFNSDTFFVETTYLDENGDYITETWKKDGVRQLFLEGTSISELLPELVSTEKNVKDKTGSITEISSEKYDFITYPLSFKPNNQDKTSYNVLEEFEYFLKTETPIGYTHTLFENDNRQWQDDFVDNTNVEITFVNELGKSETKSTKLGYVSPISHLDQMKDVITSEEYPILLRKIQKGKWNMFGGSVFVHRFDKIIPGLGKLRFLGISGDRSVQKRMFPYFNDITSDSAIRAKDIDEVGGVILSIDGQPMHATSRPDKVGGHGWSYGKNCVIFCDIERDDPSLHILDGGRKTVQPEYDEIISKYTKQIWKTITAPEVVNQFWHKEKKVRRVKDKMDMIHAALARKPLNIPGVFFKCEPSNEAEVECIFDQMLSLGFFKTEDTERVPVIYKCDTVGQYDRFCGIELNETDLGKHAQEDLVSEGHKFDTDGNVMYYPTVEMKPYISHFTHDGEKDIADVHVLVAWSDKQSGGNTKSIKDEYEFRPIRKSEITFPGSTHMLVRSDGHKCECILLSEYQEAPNTKSDEFFKTL